MRSKSQPTRAAWIEILGGLVWIIQRTLSRSPLGLRGLKLLRLEQLIQEAIRRSPLGLRGLKFDGYFMYPDEAKVAAHSGCVD